MRIAFYKAKTKLFNRLVSWWTNGPYSHCEAIIEDRGNGVALCASSSFLDGGVRFKEIAIDREHWDVIDVPGINVEDVRAWYLEHQGQKYDVLGLMAVLSPVKEDKQKWFCNESIGAAAGVPESWRFNPNNFAILCQMMGGHWLAYTV